MRWVAGGQVPAARGARRPAAQQAASTGVQRGPPAPGHAAPQPKAQPSMLGQGVPARHGMGHGRGKAGSRGGGGLTAAAGWPLALVQGQEMLPALENSVRQAERQLAPAVERELADIEREYQRQRCQLERALRQEERSWGGRRQDEGGWR